MAFIHLLTPPPGSNRKKIIILLMLIILAYTGSMGGEFQFDDQHVVEFNRLIKDLSRFLHIDWWSAFLRGSRPVTAFTFAVNYSLGRLDPFGYHIVNTLIHLCVVALIYVFTQNTLRFAGYRNNASLALIITGIFGLHPIQSQAVSYLSQRAESLASLFYLASLLCLIKSNDHGIRRRSLLPYAAGITFFVFGLGAKAIIVTFPVAYMLYDFVFLPISRRRELAPRNIPAKARTSLRAGMYVLIVVIGFVYAVYKLKALQGSRNVGFDLEEFGSFQYVLTEIRVLVTYLRLIILPFNQNIDYDYPLGERFFELNTFLSFTVLSCLLILSLFLLIKSRMKKNGDRKEYPGLIISFGILWFFILLAPSSSIIPVTDVIEEHRVYLASWGIIAAVTVAVHTLYRKGLFDNPKRDKILLTMTVLIIWVLLGVTLYERNKVWKNEKSLWADALRKSPNKSRPYMNLGQAFFEEGDYESAIFAYEKALNLPSDRSTERFELLRNLGAAQFILGRHSRALETFREALIFNPSDPDVLNNLAICLVELKRYTEAMNYALLAIRLKPSHGQAHGTVGELYFKRKEYETALRYFKEALRINPDSLVRYYNVALTLERLGNVDEACFYWEEYLQLGRGKIRREEIRIHAEEIGCYR